MDGIREHLFSDRSYLGILWDKVVRFNGDQRSRLNWDFELGYCFMIGMGKGRMNDAGQALSFGLVCPPPILYGTRGIIESSLAFAYRSQSRLFAVYDMRLTAGFWELQGKWSERLALRQKSVWHANGQPANIFDWLYLSEEQDELQDRPTHSNFLYSALLSHINPTHLYNQSKSEQESQHSILHLICSFLLSDPFTHPHN